MKPTMPQAAPLRTSAMTAADRSRVAVQKHAHGGAADVKAAAKGSAAAPKALGAGPNAEVDKLLSLRDMGILTDSEFAAALKRLIEKQGKKL